MLLLAPKVTFILLYASLSFTLTVQQANETHTTTRPEEVHESPRTPKSSGATAVILAVVIVLVFLVLIVLTALIIHVMRKRTWEDQIEEFKAGWESEEIYLEGKVMQILRKMHLARKKKPEDPSVTATTATASVSANIDKKGETQNDSAGLAATQQPIMPTVNANNSQQVTSPENRIPASGATDVQKLATDVPHDTLAAPCADTQTTAMTANIQPLPPNPAVNQAQINNTQPAVQPTEPH